MLLPVMAVKVSPHGWTGWFMTEDWISSSYHSCRENLLLRIDDDIVVCDFERVVEKKTGSMVMMESALPILSSGKS